jgi:hypothetical protein
VGEASDKFGGKEKVRKPEVKRKLGRPRRRRKNIKQGEDCIQLNLERNKWYAS